MDCTFIVVYFGECVLWGIFFFSFFCRRTLTHFHCIQYAMNSIHSMVICVYGMWWSGSRRVYLKAFSLFFCSTKKAPSVTHGLIMKDGELIYM